MKQKTKNTILIIGFIMLAIISYKLSISKTLDLRSEIKTLENKAQLSKNSPQTLQNISARERFADSVLNSNKLKNSSIQSSLLNFLNNETSKEGLEIVNFLEPHKPLDTISKKQSFQFSLRGSYQDIEKVIYKLENNYVLGFISHLYFEKKYDYKRNKSYLECNIILETYL